MALGDTEPVLITFTVSIYCEKARWALERYGIPYTENAVAPGFQAGPLKAAGSGKDTVPCLHFPGEKKCFSESGDILRWVDSQIESGGVKPALSFTAKGEPLPLLFPKQHEAEVQRLTDLFDSELGPAVRLWAEYYMFKTSEFRDELLARPVPAGQRFLVRSLWPVFSFIAAKELGLTPENRQASFATIQKVFKEVGDLLGDGRKYLVGDSLTSADIALATLGAMAVGQEYAFHKGIRDSYPDEYKQAVEAFQDTPAGKYILRLWKEDRATVLASVI